MVRRMGRSVAQKTPLTKTPAATCHRRISSAATRTSSTADVSVTTLSPNSISVLRFMRSAIAPKIAPNRMFGRKRRTIINATCIGDPVSWKTNTPIASISSQRMTPIQAPANHIHRKFASRSSASGVLLAERAEA
jgi:hypothetical protein